MLRRKAGLRKIASLLLTFLMCFSCIVVAPSGYMASAELDTSPAENIAAGASGKGLTSTNPGSSAGGESGKGMTPTQPGTPPSGPGWITVDYNSGAEKKIVFTGPAIPYYLERMYTESELKEKFATNKENGDLYNLTMLNTWPTKRLYTIRGVSMWDVFADAGIGADIYRDRNNYLYTYSQDGFVVSVGDGYTVGGGYELRDVLSGTLDLPRYKYSINDYFAADVRDPNLDTVGEEIPWYISFAESYTILTQPSNAFPAAATNTDQSLRPFFGQLNTGYPNLSLSGNNTYRIVFAGERLEGAKIENYIDANASFKGFKLPDLLYGSKMYDRANIMTGPRGAGEKIKGSFAYNAGGVRVYFEGTGVESLLHATGYSFNDTDYFTFLTAGEPVVASLSSIKAGEYTLVYHTGLMKDILSTVEDTVSDVTYYFDLYRDGQAVVKNVCGIEHTAAPDTDKNDLEIQINKARYLDPEEYTSDSWASLANALTAAGAVFADPEATQAAINDAVHNIAAQMAELTAKGSNMLMVDYNSGAEKKIVITGSLTTVNSERVYTESELKAQFAADPHGDIFGLSVSNSVPFKNLYTIRGVSLWDVFEGVGIGADVYQNPDVYLQTAGTDSYTVTLTNLNEDRYKYPADSFFSGLEAGRQAIPWYIAFTESSSTTDYPADGAAGGNALRTWFGQRHVNDINSGSSGKWVYRLVLTDRALSGADIHNNSAAYVFSLLGQGYDRASILTGPMSGKSDGLTLGKKYRGAFDTDEGDRVYYEGTGAASLLKAATNDRVQDSDRFSFANSQGDVVTAGFEDIQAGNYLIVYARGYAADSIIPIERTIDGDKYYFDLFRDGMPIVENVSGIEYAEALIVDKTALEDLINRALELVEPGYAAERWAYFTGVFAAAQAVLSNAAATAEEVDSAVLALRAVLTDMGVLEAFKAETLTITPGSSELDFNFTWYSDSVENKASTVQIAKESLVTDSGFPMNGVITTTNGAVGGAATGKTWHKAGITGLEPETAYLYRVSNDGVIFSETNRFKTGADGSFTFIVVGDPQIDNAYQDEESEWPAPQSTTAAGWANTVAGFVAGFPEARFIASVGDNVDSGGNETQWESFFAPVALRGIPLAPARGNHDNAENYYWHFNQPNVMAGGNYWYKYNNVLFVVLNTGDRANDSNIGVYAAQFDAVMKAATEAYPDPDWLFVVHHKSTASPAPHSRDEDVRLFAGVIEDLADKYGVDAVLAGHDHVYARSWVIYNHQKAVGYDGDTVINPAGTVYFTFNTASGLKYSDLLAETAWYTNKAAAIKVPQFTVVDAAENSVTFTTYRVDSNAVIDCYTIKKAAITLGDVDGNGVIDHDDATAALNHYTGIAVLAEENFPAADVDRNGIVNYFDIIAIVNHYNGTKLIEN